MPLGRKLVTVQCDCDLAEHIAGWPALDALALRDVDREGLLAFYERYGFRLWKSELEQSLGRKVSTTPEAAADANAAPAPPPALEAAPEHEVVTSWPRLEHWLTLIEAAECVALDTAADSLEPMRARIVGIGLAVEAGRAAYVPLAHAYADAPQQLPLQAVLQRLKPWLEDASRSKLGHNLKFASHVLANAGITLAGGAHDTLLQSYVLEAHAARACHRSPSATWDGAR